MDGWAGILGEWLWFLEIQVLIDYLIYLFIDSFIIFNVFRVLVILCSVF